MPAHLTADQKWIAFRLQARGLSLGQIGREVGCTGMAVSVVLRDHQRVPALPDMWSPSPWRLQLADREGISRGSRGGESCSAIGRRIARSVSTRCREIASNGDRSLYRGWRANQRAYTAARRPKPRKLRRGRLCTHVNRWLGNCWSPEQVAKRLRLEFPDDPIMWVSHGTIYQSRFVQGRGELRRELVRALRSGEVRRRPQGRLRPTGQLPDMVTISERPA